MVNLGQEMNDERVTDFLINQHTSSLTDKYASNISIIEIPNEYNIFQHSILSDYTNVKYET